MFSGRRFSADPGPLAQEGDAQEQRSAFVVSFVAGFATGVFALYHFGRIAHFSLAANLLAVPLTAFWIMPWAVIAMALMPFGLEGLALALPATLRRDPPEYVAPPTSVP